MTGSGSVAIHQKGEVCRECGKTVYKRKRAAWRKIKERDRRSGRKKRGEGPVHPYPCPHGNGWHTGHTSKTRLVEPVEDENWEELIDAEEIV